MHKDAICPRSGFFVAAVSERWRNGSKKPIELPADDPAIFSIYLQCVYQEKVIAGYEWQKLYEAVERNEMWRTVCALYSMANKFQDQQTCNLVIDEILDTSEQLGRIPDPETIAFAFEITPADSPLRKLLVDFYLYELKASLVADRAKEMPIEFLQMFAAKVALIKETEDDFTVNKAFNKKASSDKCAYHQHNPELPHCMKGKQ